MKYSCSLIALAMLALFINSVYFASSDVGIVNISGVVIYNPIDNYGLVKITIKYSEVLYESIVQIQLIGNVSDILSVVDPGGNILIYSFFRQNNSISVFVNGTDTVIVDYVVTDLFNELALNTYGGSIDLSIYRGASVRIDLFVNGIYVIESYPEVSYSYEAESELTRIVLDKPEWYFITLYSGMLLYIGGTETTLITPTPSPTTSPTPTPTPRVEETPTVEKPGFKPQNILVAVMVTFILILLIVFLMMRFLRKK